MMRDTARRFMTFLGVVVELTFLNPFLVINANKATSQPAWP
jgi:hypothetical protein